MRIKKKDDPGQRPEPPVDELPLSEAVAHGFVALGQGATASEVERWVKAHHFNVWLGVKEPTAILKAVEAEREKLQASQPKGTNGMARKKNDSEAAPGRAKVSADNNDREKAPVATPKKVASPAVDPPRQQVSKRTRPSAGRNARVEKHQKTTSGQRGKTREAKPVPAISPPRESREPRRASTGPGPTVDDLRRVRALAVKEGGIAELRQTVQRVARLADQVGGLDSLAVCLEVLEEFGVK